MRYAVYKATNGKLKIPDGSQVQREWCEKNKLNKLADYSEVGSTPAVSLFIAFIKPCENGCKSVGHVWFVTNWMLTISRIPWSLMAAWV